MNLILHTFETSLLFGTIAIGMFVALRILRFPDLTLEGSIGLASMASATVTQMTQSVTLACAAGAGTGLLCGVLTGTLASGLKIPTIFAGILTGTIAYSLANLLWKVPTKVIPTPWFSTYENPVFFGILCLTVSTLLLCLIVTTFLRSGSGLLVRLRGENPSLLKELEHSLLIWDIIGCAVANAIIGLSAVLLSHRTGYSSVSLGHGAAIGAIAAIMVADVLFPTRSFFWAFISCLIATFLLQLIRMGALRLGLPSGSLDIFVSGVVILIMSISIPRINDSKSRETVLHKIRM